MHETPFARPLRVAIRVIETTSRPRRWLAGRAPISARVRATLAALGTAVLLTAATGGPVLANHSAVNVSIVISRGTTVVWSRDETASCDDTGCEVMFLEVGRQAHDRFVRMCGDWEYMVLIPANTFQKTDSCAGSGPWSVQIYSNFNSVGNVPQFHPEPVYIHLYVVASCWGCS